MSEHEDKATAIGKEHGTDKASWFECNGTDHAREVLRGIDLDIDPEVIDSIPSADLSGQWADEYSIDQLATDCGLSNVEPEMSDGAQHDEWDTWHEERTAVVGAYETACDAAIVAEIIRVCRYQLAYENENAAIQGFIDGDPVSCALCYLPIMRRVEMSGTRSCAYWQHEDGATWGPEEHNARPLLVDPEPCNECDGGVVEQQYGYTVPPRPNMVAVQACDTCHVFSSDEDAATHRVDVWRTEAVYVAADATDDDENPPGDWWVLRPVNLASLAALIGELGDDLASVGNEADMFVGTDWARAVVEHLPVLLELMTESSSTDDDGASSSTVR